MKKLVLILLAFMASAPIALAQRSFAVYGIGFYNLENLFDIQHDEGKNDYDFLPDGSYKWDELKYSHKLHNMARALADMGTDLLPYGCAVIGVNSPISRVPTVVVWIVHCSTIPLSSPCAT